jgi:hypothetical protein
MKFGSRIGIGFAFAALAACGGDNAASNMTYESAEMTRETGRL